MRKLKAYIPKDDLEMPKQIDEKRYTAVLIRQSDHGAEADHIFSTESQLKLIQYAVRLRGDVDDGMVRLFDEGAGVSGQKRIDQRKELNRLYAHIKAGIIGSLVIIHEDRLFRDEYHTNDTTFIKLLAEYGVLLFVRTDHRRYDCTKASERNSLIEKRIASCNYLDDLVLGRMNGSQEAKALQGLFVGTNLGTGFVTKGKKKEQVILIYEPWAMKIRWMFNSFKKLDGIPNLLTTRSLCSRIEHMCETERFSVSQHGRAGRGQAGDREERMTRSHVFLALSSYRLDGRSIQEGNPVDRMPGPSADEQTRQGGGAFAGPTRARSSPCALAGMTW